MPFWRWPPRSFPTDPPGGDGRVRIAANLYTAGQETTVRLLSTALEAAGRGSELQQRLRTERDLIPNFIEECLQVREPGQG